MSRGVPPLDFASIKIPGMQLHATARKPNYFKVSTFDSGRRGPPTVDHDIVTNAASSLSARGAVATGDYSTNHLMSFRPPQTARPSKPVSARAKWISQDRNVLRFYLYFKEAVHESPVEHYRVRRCVLHYYLADDTVEINEPKVANSGIPQGSFLSKSLASDLSSPDGTRALSLRDLLVGVDLPVYSRVFRIVDCDAKTRKHFATEFGAEQSSAQPYPTDPLGQAKLASARHAAAPKPTSIVGDRAKDTLRQFLMYDRQVLRFSCLWDDSESLYGEKRYFNLHYFLTDDTMELREKYLPNCGRDKYPQFLGRRVNVVKPDGSGPYKPADLLCGSNIVVSGRTFQLLKCDEFTLEFFTKIGIGQKEVTIKQERKAIPRMEIPPYNGFGTEEDSLNSFYNLVPKPPKRNLKKMQEMADMVLRFKVQLVTDAPQDKDRIFVVAFFLADDTLGIFEPKRRNSGFMGGKFLEKGKHRNVASGNKHFEAEDFRQALIDKTKSVTIIAKTFRVLTADRFTMEFFDQQVEEKELSRADKLFRKLVNQLLLRRLDMRKMFKELDKDKSKSINREEFSVLLDRVGVVFDEEDVSLILSKFSKGHNEIYYNEFCDILSTHWTPHAAASTDKIDQLENDLLSKLRDDSTHLRKVFRKYDEDSNGKLSFKEFQGMCENYAFKCTPYEYASLMARYDTDREGSIDYNEFCDKVYECDFTSALDGAIQTEDGETLDVETYLAQLKAKEAELILKTKVDNTFQAFAESFVGKKYQLRKTFRKFDRSGDGKISMEEFIDACESVHPLNDEMKYELGLKFFPNPDDVIDYDDFMKIISKVGQREGNALGGLSQSDYAHAELHSGM